MALDPVKSEWVRRVLGVSMAPAAPTGALDAALARWTAARAAALGALKALETAFRGFEHPQRDAAIILLRAVQANLTAEPRTPQQVIELGRYLTTDDVIAEAELPNGFGITVQLRQPLLQALAGVHKAVTAAADQTHG